MMFASRSTVLHTMGTTTIELLFSHDHPLRSLPHSPPVLHPFAEASLLCFYVYAVLQLEAGLQVFLENWPEVINGGLPTVCALLCVSTACNRAVRQATAHCTINCPSEDRMNRVADFARWLPRHAGLVCNMWFGVGRRDWANHWRAGEQLLHSALLQYMMQRAPGAAGAAASPGLVLALSRLSAPWMTAPGVFNAFAAIGSLTSLHQNMSADPPPAAVFAALGAVTSLRRLRLTDARSSSFGSGTFPHRREPAPVMPAALAAALQQLPQLQELYTETPMHPVQLQLLPPSLNELSVILHPADAADMHLDMRHLTQLTSLGLQCAVPVLAQSVIPDSVLSLCVEGACNTMCSTHLQSLKLTAPHLCMALVEQVPQLPVLRLLEIPLDDRCACCCLDTAC